MTFQQELSSWFSPNGPSPADPPQIGSKAPENTRVDLQAGRPAVITFLRHCGCPHAEKTFLNLRDIAKDHSDVDFIAVSHSDQESTHTWLRSLPQAGSEPLNLRVVVDDKLETYAAWGLGIASWAHVLDPRSLYQGFRLGQDEGINIKPTSSGSRWQESGFYAVDSDSIVRWGRPADRADEIPDLEAAVRSLSSADGTEAKL